MIKKEEAKKLGLKVQEQKDTMGEKNAKLIEKLKSLLPNIINSDGTLDIKALKDVIDISQTTSNNQGYELTFAGKGLARWMAGIPTKKELKTEKEESKNFQKTQNVLIRGDNLDVLKILYQNYHNKIKMIYIDPPYNTKNDEFIYKDDFKKSEQELIEEYGLNKETTDFLQNIYGTKSHSGWLAFMYPRLKLARDLLREDGVIFISIDDNEQANLKIMCDEIFGEDNFVGLLKWKKKKQPSFLHGHISSIIEYVIVYAKRLDDLDKLSLEKIAGDSKPLFNSSNRLSERKFKKGLKSQYEEGFIKKGIYRNKTVEIEFLNDVRIEKYRSLNSFSLKAKFRDGQNNIDKYQDEDVVYLTKNNSLRRNILEEEKSKKKNILDLLLDWGQNQDAFDELLDLFKIKDLFTNPKPTLLLKNIIKSSTKPSDNDLILDFFAGSGTTGDAVMQLNAEDGGNRNFILVQWDEKINPKKNKEAYNFCKDNNLPPVISNICLERLNRAGEKIKTEHQNKRGLFSSSEELDIGYKVFSLKKKPEIGGEDEIFKLKNERQSTWDTLFNMLSTTGKSLDTPIQEIQKNILYECDGEIYLIAGIDREVIENYRNNKINIDGYAEIDLESFLNMQVATRENIHIIY